MKIIAFSDVHEDIDEINRIIKLAKDNKANFIVCAGDISNFGENLDKILLKLKCGVPFIIIPGNHEDENELKNICKKYNFIYLHNRSYSYGDYVFFGRGSGGFSEIDREFESLYKKFKNTIKKEDKIIFVTHAPPYGTKLDSLPMGHVGCRSFTKFVKEIKPILHISGHLHETAGIIDKLGNTMLVNVSLKGRLIEIE